MKSKLEHHEHRMSLKRRSAVIKSNILAFTETDDEQNLTYDEEIEDAEMIEMASTADPTAAMVYI